jgi:hypothetical protein
MSTTQVSVVVPADQSHTGATYRREMPIDDGVADLVRRLNHATFGDDAITRAACSGHGMRPGSITLLDGRTLIVAQDDDEAEVLALACGAGRADGGRLFHLVRYVDHTGVSGIGRVAMGWLFKNGVVVVRWGGEFGTTTIHHKGMDSVRAIHCHNGATEVEWQGSMSASLPASE